MFMKDHTEDIIVIKHHACVHYNTLLYKSVNFNEVLILLYLS